MLFTRLFVHLHSHSSFWWHVDMTTLLLVHVFHAKQNVWQSSRGSFSPSSSGHKTGESSVQRPSVFDATTATLNAFYEKKSMKRQNYRVFSLTWPASMQIYWTKESVCIRKEFNSHRTRLGHQHGRRFIVLGHQHGRRDVMWKHSIDEGMWLVRGHAPGVLSPLDTFRQIFFKLFDNRQKTYVLRFHSNLSSGACLSALSISRIFSRISRYLLIFLWVVPANGCGTS